RASDRACAGSGKRGRGNGAAPWPGRPRSTAATRAHRGRSDDRPSPDWPARRRTVAWYGPRRPALSSPLALILMGKRGVGTSARFVRRHSGAATFTGVELFLTQKYSSSTDDK